MSKTIADEFDQFYTKPGIADYCCEVLKKKLESNINFENRKFLEPSAGTGVFIDSVRKVFGDETKIDAFDIDPKHKDIKKADFLKKELEGEYITIGNPPFGKRSSLAIDFFNKAAKHSDVIAFIVPLQFDKYSVQKHLDSRFKLIHSEILIPNAFIYNGKSYQVRCCFQIWTTLETDNKNLRILKAPATTHPDFEMYQYNNTEEALKYFDKTIYKWDFAVYRQGFYDYTERITDPKELNKRIQYIFFKAKTPEVEKRLRALDFEKLSHKNTTTPGFGKADVVQYYKEVYPDE